MARPKTRDDKLKDRLLAESIALLEQEGPTAITARRVASIADTSTAAVYELFGSKSGLVRTIFYEGFGQLADLLDALAATGDPQRDLVAAFDGSRAFAVAHPMLFEVMYARPFAEFTPSPADFVVARRIYDRVTGLVGAVLALPAASRQVIDATHVFVALDRGLVSSELGGLLGESLSAVDRRREFAFESAIVGLLATVERQS